LDPVKQVTFQTYLAALETNSLVGESSRRLGFCLPGPASALWKVVLSDFGRFVGEKNLRLLDFCFFRVVFGGFRNLAIQLDHKVMNNISTVGGN